MALGLSQSPLASLFEDVQVFSRLEADGLAGRDRDLGAGAGISSDAGLPGFDGEDPEAAQLDTIALGEGLLHGLEDGIDGRFGLGAYESGPFNDTLDEILFDQRGTFRCKVLGEAKCGLQRTYPSRPE